MTTQKEIDDIEKNKRQVRRRKRRALMDEERASETRQEVFTIGYQKSGNHWISRLLSDAIDSPLISVRRIQTARRKRAMEGLDRPGPYVVRMRHYGGSWLPKEGDPTVSIVRDPRDIVVSMKAYRAHWTWEEIYNRCRNWQTPVRKWMNFGSLVRFEDLLDDTLGELTRILDEMELTYDPARLPEVVERQSWAARKKELDDAGKKHVWYRKILGAGKSGSWKKQLPKKWRKRCHEAFWDLMNELGYESNIEWWK